VQKNSNLIFLFLGVISLSLFFYPPTISFKIDDLASKIFYVLNRKNAELEEIVVVEINDESLRRMNDQWPFRRSLHAKVLDILNKEKAKVVCFDIVFAGESSLEEDDRRFLEAIKNFNGTVVLASFFDKEGKPTYPKLEFREKSLVGFVNVVKDKDGVARKLRGYFRNGEALDYSLAIRSSAAFYDLPIRKTKESIWLGDKKIPVDKDGHISINYLLNREDILTVPFHDLISEEFSPGTFSNKIVLIAPTLNIAQDVHPTPAGNMPGTFIQVNILANIIKQNSLKSSPLYFDLLTLGLAFALMAYLMASLTLLRRVFLSAGVLLLIFWVAIVGKFFGWQFFCGRVTVSSLSFLILGNIYTYMSFLVSIIKIKNKMAVDPITHLYEPRFFFERLDFELRSIGKKKGCFVIVKLEGLKFSLKGESFKKVRVIWREIASFLFSISNLWSIYNQEVLIGRISDLKDLAMIKGGIETATLKRNIKVTVKIGGFKISSSLDRRGLVSELEQRLNDSSKSVTIFNINELSLSTPQGKRSEDFLSSLSADIEERNRELLTIVEKLKKEEKKAKEAYLELISALITALESRDVYTEGHTKRVCKYALMLADKLDLSDEEKGKIRKSALLHDLGKIGIPDAILHKKGPLTDEEFSTMKQHGMFSAKILKPIKDFQEIISYIIHHHENFDGSGYPQGLAADSIPLGARILAVADVFDALTTMRDYKEAFSIEKTIKILTEDKAKKLDPSLVDKFLELLKEQPDKFFKT